MKKTAHDDYKQAIVVRTDIGMSKGKLAAQCAHASLTASEIARRKKKTWWKYWIAQGQKKVILRVETEKDLQDLENRTASLDLPSALIKDKGLTQVSPGTVTCLGIGPAPTDLVDRITGHLKLL